MADKITPFDLANAYRTSAGLKPMTTESGKSKIVSYTYRVILQDAEQTSKDIISADVHQVGDMILDLATGIRGKITRAERTSERVA